MKKKEVENLATVPLRDGKKQENSEKGELYTRNFRHWDITDYGNTAYNINYYFINAVPVLSKLINTAL